MYTEEFMDNSPQYVTSQNENLRTKSTAAPIITTILSTNNEEVSIGSIVLKAKKYSHKVIVIDDTIIISVVITSINFIMVN